MYDDAVRHVMRVTARLATSEDEGGCIPVIAVRRPAKALQVAPSTAVTEPEDAVSRLEEESARAIYTGAGGQLDEFGQWTLRRFLLAHNGKASLAAKNLRKTAAWRAKVGADEIRRWMRAGMRPTEFPRYAELAPYLLHILTELENHAGDVQIWLSLESVFEAAPFISACTDVEWYSFAVHAAEYGLYHADRISAERNRLVRWATVCDTAGLGPRHMTLPLFFRVKPTLPLVDLYYPELIGHMQVINAAPVVYYAWRMVKPLLSKALQQRVAISDRDNSTFDRTFAGRTPRHHVPICWGGACSSLRPEAAEALPIAASAGIRSFWAGNALAEFLEAAVSPSQDMAMAHEQEVRERKGNGAVVAK